MAALTPKRIALPSDVETARRDAEATRIVKLNEEAARHFALYGQVLRPTTATFREVAR